MKIHEYQGKQLFRTHGVPVLRGIACTTVDQAEAAARELGSPVVVVKSQIHAGGRGKGTVFADEAMTQKVMDGGVKVVKSPEAAREMASKLLGNYLTTIQTGDGCKQVKTLYVEDGCQIAKELYFSILLDRAAAAPVLIVSSEGGMDIEEVAHSHPEKILKAHFDPHFGLGAWQARSFGFEIGLAPAQIGPFVKTAQALAKCFIETDADMLEVNPLVVTVKDEIVALDCRLMTTRFFVIPTSQRCLIRTKKILPNWKRRATTWPSSSLAETSVAWSMALVWRWPPWTRSRSTARLKVHFPRTSWTSAAAPRQRKSPPRSKLFSKINRSKRFWSTSSVAL